MTQDNMTDVSDLVDALEEGDVTCLLCPERSLYEIDPDDSTILENVFFIK